MSEETLRKRSRAQARELPGAASLVLSVAGVCLHFRGAERIRLAAPAEVYSHFLRASPVDGPCIDTVEMEVLGGEVPRLDLLETIFRTGDAWTLLRDERRFVFRMQPNGDASAPALWSITADREFRRGRVYCSEKILSASGKAVLARNIIQYPIDQLLIMHVAAARAAGLLMHAAGGNINGQGVLFAGPSGAGKSTVTRLLSENEGMRFLSDDRVVLRRFGERLRVFGTPWPGDAGAVLNESMPLKAICFLSHAETTGLRELDSAQALERLLRVVSVPWYQPDLAESTLALCEFLLERYPVYELSFKPVAHELSSVLDDFSRAA
jgi:hypothetical protein